MRPLIKQLALRLYDFSSKFFYADFPAIKFISAPDRFLVNDGEITGQGRSRISRPLESEQLRMMPVTPRAPLQNFLREQRLTPKRHQAFAIEMFWMNRPKSHDPMIMRRETGLNAKRSAIGRIHALFLIPELVPVMVVTGFIEGEQVTKTLLSPELSWPFKATLFLPTG